MFGLGAVAHRRRLRPGRTCSRKAVLIALALQLLVLPAAVLRARARLRPAAAARRRADAAGGLAGRDDGQPVQSPLPRGRRAQHHADRGELADRRRHPAPDHQPRARVLRPGRRRHPRPAARQDRCRCSPIVLVPGRPSGCSSGTPGAGVRRPHGQAGADPLRGGAGARSSSAPSWPSGRTSSATSATSDCPALLFCLASLAAGLLRPAGARGRASGRRSRAPSRSACTTAPWPSPSPSRCWAASSSPSRPRSTACSCSRWPPCSAGRSAGPPAGTPRRRPRRLSSGGERAVPAQGGPPGLPGAEQVLRGDGVHGQRRGGTEQDVGQQVGLLGDQ